MRPRTAVLDTFSTFAQLAGDRFERWVNDPRLQRNMRRYQDSVEAKIEVSGEDGQQAGFWALYWYYQWQKQWQKQWQAQQEQPRQEQPRQEQSRQEQSRQEQSRQEQSRQEQSRQEKPRHLTGSLAKGHLYAYLQEPCYWAVEQVVRRFAQDKGTLADGFQAAIAHTERILTGYSPDYGSSLKTYARTAFGNLIRDRLRQQKAANICSDGGLLRKLSQTQLKQSLLTAGFAYLDSDILIWQCFKAVCTPHADDVANGCTRKISWPDDEALNEIAVRYNQQRTRLTPVPVAIAKKDVSDGLMRCVQAARSYLNPSVISLNQQQYDEGSERLDSLSADEMTAPMTQLVAAEARVEQLAKRRQIGAVLEGAIANLSVQEQALLQLYYQKQLTQKEIANHLQLQQYQVSRKLSRLRQKLLSEVAQWSQAVLHISIESDVLANINTGIHEWLWQKYAGDDLEDTMKNSLLGSKQRGTKREKSKREKSKREKSKREEPKQKLSKQEESSGALR